MENSNSTITHPQGFTSCNFIESTNDAQRTALFENIMSDNILHIGMELYGNIAKVVTKSGKVQIVEFSLIGVKSISDNE